MKNYIEKHPYLTLLVMWGCVFVSHLGVLYPNIMEARNFVTAREMLTNDNWLLTTMDGLPRYEKPPLPTWLTAFSAELFGLDNIAALRLPSALVTLALLLILYLFSHKLTQNKTYAIISTLIAGTSFYIIFAGRNGTWDIYAHTFMLIGIYFLFQFFQTNVKKYRNALTAGLLIGLSFMSKGPVSHYALLIPFLIAYGSIYKFQEMKKKWLPLFLMIFAIGVLSAWWAIYIYIMDTADAARIAEKESSRWIGYELKPFYYYWNFFIQSGIWAISAFTCLFYPYLKSRVSNLRSYQFSLLWTIATVVLLSLVPTKKSRYLLPVLIPLAMTTGFYIEYLFKNFDTITSKWEKWPIYFNYGLIAIVGILFPLGAFIYFGNKIEGYYMYYTLTSMALFATGIYILFQLSKRNFPKIFYATIAFVMFVITLGFPLSNALLSNPMYNSISKLQDSKIPVYTLDGLAPELIWDYGKVSTYKSKKELLYSINENQFGILASYTKEHNKLDFLKKKYKVEMKETFDLNPLDSTKRGYKNRLKTDFYIATKK